jgi:hypothetical protein
LVLVEVVVLFSSQRADSEICPGDKVPVEGFINLESTGEFAWNEESDLRNSMQEYSCR